jgi:hypothetical protein
MSEHEALLRFHDWCAAWHGKAQICRLWRCRCVMHPQRSPLINVLVRSGSCAEAGSTPQHEPLTYRIVKEI